MDEILLSVTLLSDGKIITWYDLSKKCSQQHLSAKKNMLQ